MISPERRRVWQYLYGYIGAVKTTVELSESLFEDTKRFARAHGKTFKDVLTDALEVHIYNGERKVRRPGWEDLFGAFKGDPEIEKVQSVIDEEFRRIDPEDWA